MKSQFDKISAALQVKTNDKFENSWGKMGFRTSKANPTIIGR